MNIIGTSKCKTVQQMTASGALIYLKVGNRSVKINYYTTLHNKSSQQCSQYNSI